MPYISCDGRTYSRYDQSVYVQECIRKEKLMYELRELACSRDPVCRSEREAHDQQAQVVGVAGIVLIVFLFYKLVRMIGES